MPTPTDLPADLPTRLNLGCGFDKRDGYLNVDFQDFHDPDLVADVRDLAALPDGHFSEVMAIDVLEHMERTETAKALAEWHRVLAPGGTLRLQVPDVLAVGQLLQERDSYEEHELFIHHLYGTQAYTGDFHLAGFTDRLMIELLLDAGFDHIRTHCEHQWLLVVDAGKSTMTRAEREPLAMGFGRGTYPAEDDGNGGRYRWCEADASVLLDNVTEHAVTVDLTLGLAGHFDRTKVPFRLDGLGPARTMTLGATPAVIRERLVLDPGGVRLRLHSDGPRVEAPGDRRQLYFRLTELTVTPLA